MALILNLETATTNCSVSLANNGRLIALKEHNSPSYSHSEQLHQFIDDVLLKASLTFKDLDAIAVSKGPGSYTGLRIGVSAAKGLCFALDIPLISILTLKSMATQVKVAEGVIIPVLDARRMEVYAAVFDKDYNQLKETWAEIITESSFGKFADKTVLIAGNGAGKCQDLLRNANFEFDTSIVPSAKEMAQLSFETFQNEGFEDLAYFEPYYLKDFIVQKKQTK